MQDPLPDNTVILIILSTLILVFSLIFMFRPQQSELNPSIEWKEPLSTSSSALEI